VDDEDVYEYDVDDDDDDDDDCREQMVFVTWLHVRLCSLVRLYQGFPLFLYVIALCCQCDRGERASSVGHAGV
jgi:hypothetical protein